MSARKSLQSAHVSSTEQSFVWLFLRPAEVDHLCHPFEEFADQREFLTSIGVPFLVSPSGRPVVGREALFAILNQAGQETVKLTGCQIKSQSDDVRSDLPNSCDDASIDLRENADDIQIRTLNRGKKKIKRSTEQGIDPTNLSDDRTILLRSVVVDQIGASAKTGTQRENDRRECGVQRGRVAATRLAELFPLSTMLENVAAAKVLGKKPQTLRRWSSQQSGPIQSTKVVGRIMWSIADLQNLLDGSVSSI
ncbi:DUF4224 domain-containing protein [Variovorax sp. RHLX14]|uniref:DUF4224 domain-containing protein n=1 Tax=Variovorax sp. RHLX14 TaxID=1259731 RepID=UPI003F46765B